MILADALGTLWFSALVFIGGFVAGWYVKGRHGNKFKFCSTTSRWGRGPLRIRPFLAAPLVVGGNEKPPAGPSVNGAGGERMA